MTKTIKAWKITATDVVSLTDHEIAGSVPAGKLRVQPLFCGVCGSDDELIRKGGAHSAHSGPCNHIIPGHELCGKVVEFGEGVTGFELGDTVVVEPALPCGECPDCKSGAYNCCRATGYWATPPVDGCFAQFIDVLPRWTFKVPAGLDPMIASLTEPLGACVEAVFGGSRVHPQIETDQWTLILGGGNIAMGVLFTLKALFSTEKVIVAARKQADLDFAVKIGAKHVVLIGDDERTAAAMKQVAEIAHGGVKNIIECTGTNEVIRNVLKSGILLGYGNVVAVGCQYVCEIDFAWLRRRSGKLITVRRSNDKFKRTLEMLSEHQEAARLLIGKVGTFDKLDDALLKGGGEPTGTDGPKTVIRF